MRRGVLCTPPDDYKEIAISCKRIFLKKNKTTHSRSLVTIYDPSIDDRGDLPNERLAIECLPTSSATMMKKRTKSVF